MQPHGRNLVGRNSTHLAPFQNASMDIFGVTTSSKTFAFDSMTRKMYYEGDAAFSPFTPIYSLIIVNPIIVRCYVVLFIKVCLTKSIISPSNGKKLPDEASFGGIHGGAFGALERFREFLHVG